MGGHIFNAPPCKNSLLIKQHKWGVHKDLQGASHCHNVLFPFLCSLSLLPFLHLNLRPTYIYLPLSPAFPSSLPMAASPWENPGQMPEPGHTQGCSGLQHWAQPASFFPSYPPANLPLPAHVTSAFSPSLSLIASPQEKFDLAAWWPTVGQDRLE